MSHDFCFEIESNKIYIKYIYGSIINITIENYLKRIEDLKKQKNIDILIIPSNLAYNLEHLNWAIFITKHRFYDKLNVSKDISKELLLTLNCTDQLNKIDYNNSKKYFICFLSNKKLTKKEVLFLIGDNFKEEEITAKSFNKKEIIKKYNLRTKDKITELIEKMSQRSRK